MSIYNNHDNVSIALITGLKETAATRFTVLLYPTATHWIGPYVCWYQVKLKHVKAI